MINCIIFASHNHFNTHQHVIIRRYHSKQQSHYQNTENIPSTTNSQPNRHSSNPCRNRAQDTDTTNTTSRVVSSTRVLNTVIKASRLGQFPASHQKERCAELAITFNMRRNALTSTRASSEGVKSGQCRLILCCCFILLLLFGFYGNSNVVFVLHQQPQKSVWTYYIILVTVKGFRKMSCLRQLGYTCLSHKLVNK